MTSPAADAEQYERSEEPRSFNPTRIEAASPARVIDDDDERDVDADDLDVTPVREGADIVTTRELGDGEHVSTDLEEDNDGEGAGDAGDDDA
jgi:hypothetical protein